MTEELPIRPKEDYEIHKPSEQEGLLEDFDTSHDPEYLLEPESETETTFQLDFGYFQYQDTLGDYT